MRLHTQHLALEKKTKRWSPQTETTKREKKRHRNECVDQRTSADDLTFPLTLDEAFWSGRQLPTATPQPPTSRPTHRPFLLYFFPKIFLFLFHQRKIIVELLSIGEFAEFNFDGTHLTLIN